MSYLYDFGLSAEEEARAKRIHDDAIVIDIVNMGTGGPAIYQEPEVQQAIARLPSPNEDILSFLEAFKLPYQLFAEGESTAIQRWWQESGMTSASMTWPGISDQVIAYMMDLQRVITQCDWLEIAHTAKDIRRIKAEGKHSLFWYCQPQAGTGLSTNLQQLEKAKEHGLQSLMLTYNRMDLAGVGCIERVDAGLSYLGVDIIKTCEDLQILVDVSHCGNTTTLDACKVSSKPITANHTSAETLFAANRAKSDDEIRAIADTGGLIGVVAVPFFLTNDPNPTVDAMLDHVEYIANLVGWQHVGIASDWPFQAPQHFIDISFGGAASELGFREEDNIDTTITLNGFEDSRSMRNISRGLVKRGYSDEQIAGVLGENYLRVLESIQI